ncbi:cytochrome c family protein [Nisaea acidiphila]|uniref:Cytochrome c family protein n=1 Tax=Nisaea acidiphila TaxID=1862145 RepID=A0A9J7AN74_9PROT|nr:cytochrome c family protein [Nisaea acidiphila]UUX48631.1 cytochrome c family protein [Nisaea acidiphila]
MLKRIIITGSIALLAFAAGPRESSATPDLPQYRSDVHVGVTSCAGSTCHGAATPFEKSVVLQNEYVTWSQKDSHAKAYTVLMNDASKRIAANLGLANAHEADICLDCHADNVPANMRGQVFQISDGVGCEACHGGSIRWLGQHVGVRDHAKNVAAGMYPLEDPVKRAELCLSCHFGDDNKFVTHRIMGAGHPRMSFELDTFTAIQPAHYVIDDDYRKRKQVANGMQTWAIGQAIALERRVDALLDPKRGMDGIFPELVLFDCQACHHSLTEPRWQARPSTGLGPGVVRFDDSNLLMLRVLVTALDAEKGATLARQTTALHKASTESVEAFHTAAKALKETTGDLVAMFSGHSFGSGDIAKLLAGLLGEAKSAEYSDYAGAEQALMGISAVVSAAAEMGMKDVAETAQDPLAKAFAALAKYDAWDYAAFRSAVESIPVPN